VGAPNVRTNPHRSVEDPLELDAPDATRSGTLATDQNDDEFDDGVEVEEDGEVARLGRNDLKSLRQAAKDGRKAKALERELAFTKAGIDTDSALGQIFMRGYDGELDPGVISEAAAGMGITGQKDPDPTDSEPSATDSEPPDTELDDSERQALASRRSASTQGEFHPEPDKNPYDEATRIHDEAIAAGAKREDAMMAAFAHVTAEAISGNEKVIAGRDGRIKQ
jgi:hypothetical protein